MALDIVQIAIVLVVLYLLVRPTGRDMAAVFTNGKTWLDPVLNPVDNTIYPLILERLFDKFYRLSTDSGGIGLGLTIARGIVEAHHGRIWAENVGQRGVAFSFTIPALAQPAFPAPGSPKNASVA